MQWCSDDMMYMLAQVLLQWDSGLLIWLAFHEGNTSSQDIMHSCHAALQTTGEPSGQAVVELGFKPCCVTFTHDGQFLFVGGTSNNLQMFTRDGILVDTVASKGSWVWSCAVRPTEQSSSIQIVCGCEDGSLSLEVIQVGIAHGIYKVRPLLYFGECMELGHPGCLAPELCAS
jgi:hypothetical protein